MVQTTENTHFSNRLFFTLIFLELCSVVLLNSDLLTTGLVDAFFDYRIRPVTDLLVKLVYANVIAVGSRELILGWLSLTLILRDLVLTNCQVLIYATVKECEALVLLGDFLISKRLPILFELSGERILCLAWIISRKHSSALSSCVPSSCVICGLDPSLLLILWVLLHVLNASVEFSKELLHRGCRLLRTIQARRSRLGV